MPNVPRVPGVPPLLSYAVNAISLVANTAIQELVGLARPVWGLFKDGVPVIVADTVASFDYKQSWAVADYPIEGGGFENYDKVATPFEVKLRYAAGGSEDAREALIATVAANAGTLTLFDAVTPEAVYEKVNITHYGYPRRAEHGVGLLVIDVWCVQIREDAQPAFSNTKTPNGASPVNGGQVQATPASAQSSALEFQ